MFPLLPSPPFDWFEMRNLAHFITFPLLALLLISSFASLALANPLGSRSKSSLSTRTLGSEPYKAMMQAKPDDENDPDMLIETLRKSDKILADYERNRRVAMSQTPDEDVDYKQAHTQFMRWSDKLYMLHGIPVTDHEWLHHLHPWAKYLPGIKKYLGKIRDDYYQRFRGTRSVYLFLLMSLDAKPKDTPPPPGSLEKAIICDIYWLNRGKRVDNPLLDYPERRDDDDEDLIEFVNELKKVAPNQDDDGCKESVLAPPYPETKETDKEETDKGKTDKEKTDKGKTNEEKTDKETYEEKTDKEKTDKGKTDEGKTDKGFLAWLKSTRIAQWLLKLLKKIGIVSDKPGQ